MCYSTHSFQPPCVRRAEMPTKKSETRNIWIRSVHGVNLRQRPLTCYCIMSDGQRPIIFCRPAAILSSQDVDVTCILCWWVIWLGGSFVLGPRHMLCVWAQLHMKDAIVLETWWWWGWSKGLILGTTSSCVTDHNSKNVGIDLTAGITFNAELSRNSTVTVRLSSKAPFKMNPRRRETGNPTSWLSPLAVSPRLSCHTAAGLYNM